MKQSKEMTKDSKYYLGSMRQSNVTIEGVELDLRPFDIVLTITIPGTLAQERLSIIRTLLTNEGELVFVTKSIASKRDNQHEMATNRNRP